MKNRTKLLIFVGTFAFIFGLWFLYQGFVGITGATITQEKIIPSESGAPIQVYFCPQDDCKGKLIALIENSQSVDCALYDLSLSDVKEALKQKSYRLVVDQSNQKFVKGMNYKTNTGALGLMHNKFCVFDNETIFSGSFNPTTKQNFVDSNNIIIIPSKYLAENYENEFQELWSGRFAEGEPVKYPQVIYNNETIENYFCPEDACTEHLLAELTDASSEIKFLTYSFTDNKIGDLLLEKIKSGVSISGVFDKSQAGSQYSEFYKLDGAADVKLDNLKGLLHHKVFIIDRKTVATGSFNPTRNADTRNDENLLIIHSPAVAERYLEEFDLVFGNESV